MRGTGSEKGTVPPALGRLSPSPVGPPDLMPLSTALLDSPMRQAEQALRRPSSAVWLRSVCLRTSRFEESLAFYVTALGLTLGSVDVHPMTSSMSARLLDAEGQSVFELVDAADAAAPGHHEFTFGMPRRTVTLLRSRLDGMGVSCTESGGALCFHDPDGLRLRVEAL